LSFVVIAYIATLTSPSQALHIRIIGACLLQSGWSIVTGTELCSGE